MIKTSDLPLLILLLLGTCFLFALTFLHCEAPRGTATLIGNVEWVALDQKNEVSLVAISTESEEYIVGDDAKGRELLTLVHKKVRVKGRVTENEDGQRTIHVSSYALVPQ
jgi:hypothetical protein